MLAIKLTENDLLELGIAVDPQDPSKTVPIEQVEDALPDGTWSLERLASYVHKGLSESDALEVQAIQIARRSTVQYFQAGRALHFARLILLAQGRGKWGRWLEKNDIARTSAWEARVLYERTRTEENVSGLTRSEALDKYVHSAAEGVDSDRMYEDSEHDRKENSCERPSEDALFRTGSDATGVEEQGRESHDLPDERQVRQAMDADDSTITNPDHESSLVILMKVVSRLVFLEEEMDLIDLEEEEMGDFLTQVDLGIELFNRLRGRMTHHAA
jgi:hypothetical protein